MKALIRDIVILIVFILISCICKLQLDDFFMNTIFTVSGIMFSIGLGLIATFNLQGIKNKSFILKIRNTLNSVRNLYIKYFTVTTIVFILDNYLREKKINQIDILLFDRLNIHIDLSVFFCLILLYSILYYIINFLSIQKLNNDIFDELNK